MEDIRQTWSEDASDVYQRIAAIAVPHRAEQIAALLMLLPFGTEDQFRVVELGCGEGRLAAAILEAFPQATVTALDGSESMLAATGARLAGYGERFEIEQFDLLRDDWWHHLDGAGAVVSSLAVHHLDGPGKQRFYAAARQRIAAPGALLIADVIQPAHSRANEYYAQLYDQLARQRSIELTGSDGYYQDFLTENWNMFRYPDDDWDKPSRIFEHLRWLDEAGFDQVDCFWMLAGHAIYGGYTGDESISGEGLKYERALEIATDAIR